SSSRTSASVSSSSLGIRWRLRPRVSWSRVAHGAWKNPLPSPPFAVSSSRPCRRCDGGDGHADAPWTEGTQASLAHRIEDRALYILRQVSPRLAKLAGQLRCAAPGGAIAVCSPRCPFRKSGARRTSCPRKRASSPHGARLLDARFRGHDPRAQALAVYLGNGPL